MALTKFTEKLISDSFKASISGSDTTESSSFASRVTLVEGGTTSKTLVSSSAQIADDISGSLSSTAIASLGASIVSASVLSSPSQGTIRLAINGVNTDVDSGLQAGDSPTFAGGTVTGDFAVGGTLTAQEVHTEFESASILFTSGSTQFGNSSDDVHDFKGNKISGSVTSTGSFGSAHFMGTGGVGIGTNNPGRLLDLVTPSDAVALNLRMRSADDFSYIIFTDHDVSEDYIGQLAVKRTGTSAGEMQFYTSGDNLRMVINNSGLVGIGTNNPTETLFVNGVTLSTTGYIAQHDTSYYRLSSANGTERARFILDGSDLQVKMGGSEKVRIDSSGNVGIATNNPSELIHLYSTSANSPNILIQNENDSAGEAGAAGGIEFYLKDDNGSNPDFQDLGIIRWTGHDKDNPYNKFTAAAITGSADDPGNSSGRIDFGVAYSDSMMNAMTIRAASSGVSRVGIGSNSPGADLDVGHATDPRIRMTRTDSTIVTDEELGSLQFAADDPSAGAVGASIQSKASSPWSSNNYGAYIRFLTTPDNSGDQAERVRITEDGYVGIGTDAPEGPFHVHSPNGADYGGYTMTVKNLDETANQGNTLYVYGGNNSVQDAVLRVDTRTQGTALACLGTGNVGVGLTGPNVPFHVRKAGNGKAGNIARFAQENDSDSVLMYGRGSGAYGASSADACMAVATMETSGRSINAGGTINASGADYAEYETKRADCGTIEKGDIVGFDTNGLITDKWTNAVTFGIKSTNPSYVGGDTWGVGVSSGSIETERQKVDRIAYSGKVPCNVTGSNVGDYIIPIQVGDGIGGVAKSSPTYDEYKQSVGVVRTISGSLPIVVVKTL